MTEPPDLFVRIDDRLIHGQVIMGWVPHLRPKRIVVVSASAASDPTAEAVMAMGVPEEIDFRLVLPEEAEEAIGGGAATLLLAPGPQDLLPLARAGVALGKINVGGVRASDGREFLRDLILTEEDVKAFRTLFELGYECERRMLPGAASLPLRPLLTDGDAEGGRAGPAGEARGGTSA